MVRKEKTQLYEGMYIVSSTLSEDARKKAVERITSSITSRGGEIHKVHDQGRKKLAYEIVGKKEGYYYLIYFSLQTNFIEELWREYQLNEDLVRFMTLHTEEVVEEIKFKPFVQS
jgi:small subunit ribosomal protein S6